MVDNIYMVGWCLHQKSKAGPGGVRASPGVSKKNQHLKLYFAPKNNFLRFSLKLKGCELQQ